MDLVAGLAIVLAALAGAPDGELVSIRPLVSQDPIRPGDRFSVALVLDLAPGHHIYHPEQETDLVEGTRLSFDESPGLRVLGSSFPPGHPERSEDLDATIRELTGTVVIRADLEATADLAIGPRELVARLSYQVCTAAMCKLFATDQPHRIPLAVAPAGTPTRALHPEVFKLGGGWVAPPDVPPELGGGWVAPPDVPPDVPPVGPATAVPVAAPPRAAPADGGWLDVRGALADGGIFLALLAAFAVGVVSSLSPCVFPMIPVTVAYFGRQAGGCGRGATLRLAALFVAGIALFFAGVGVLASVWGLDPVRVLASPWVVAGLSAVLYGLAFSMLGFYEIALPSGLLSRIGGGREGALGALGMGLALAPVALPCVGPFAGALLVLVFQRQDPVFGAAFMGVYGAGLGTLFLALALGIASLPRAGAWMASLKQAFGVVVLWLPVWFISNLLEPGSPATLVLAGLTACVSGSFLGVFRPLEAEARPGVLLGRGLALPLVVGGAWLVVAGLAAAGWGPAAGPRPLAGAEGIRWLSDFEQARARAEAEGRPMLVDFYSRACIPCREMDATVFRDPRVVDEARRFVAVKLDIGAGEATSRLRLERYASAELPLYVFHDSQGRFVPGAKRGKTDVEDFLNVMRSVR